MQAYYKTIDEIKNKKDIPLMASLIEIIAQLSHPIPERSVVFPRRKGFITSLPQYSLIRYISIIDRIAKQVEIKKV